MSLHDAYARMTPFEIAFPNPDALAELGRAAQEEAEARAADVTDPGAFETLPSVRAFVSELGAPDAQAGVVRRLAVLSFHAAHFLRAGRPLWLLETAAARRLVEERPAGEPAPPAAAGYLQLPQHLFWTGGAGGAPESIDGLFWTASPAGRLHVLAITGMHPGRPGFGVSELPSAPVAEAAAWADARVREEGADFESALPGAEMDRLLEVIAAGELLKLLARFFAQVASEPETLERSAPHGAARPGAPRPSALPFTRVRLAGGAAA